MALHVMDEANHCLGCKVPRCQQGCPIHTNIPEVIRLLKANKLDEAGRMLFENNPLTTVCSLVCNHENQCEGHCVRGIKGAPVHFSVIENYISSTYASQMTQGPAPSNGKKAAIIGSGPAGLTIAVILARYGYDVTIFESHDKIGGVLRYGIPEFRLPKTVLDDFEYRHLRLKGIKVRPNTDVGKALKIEDLFRDGYKAIFIGTGVWRPNTLHIKGESLGNVHYAINYLQNPDVYHLGERAIVIGAGNFWRGRQGNDMDRSVADHMGMLATMINCLAIKDVFEHLGMKAEVLSALSMPKIAQLFTKEAAIDAMENGKILILGCGTGNPYFTTDTTAVLRGIEVEADICLFAKNVDGVYTADPKKDPNAKKYDRISYGEMLEKDLKVIDAAAAALCRDNDMPVLIFDLGDGSNIEKAAAGEQIGTVLY